MTFIANTRLKVPFACLLFAAGCAELPNEELDEPFVEQIAQAITKYNGCVEYKSATTKEIDDAFCAWSGGQVPGVNGDILRCQRLTFDKSRPGYDVYRVVYRTSTRVTQNGVTTDLALPATGTIFVPSKPATPPAVTPPPSPIIAHTHGLSGIIAKRECAPSAGRKLDSIDTLYQIGTVVKDPIVVAPDYVGLGLDHGARVPDVNLTIRDHFWNLQTIRPFAAVTHPFVSIVGEGRATVDLVRAARTLPDANTGDSPNWLVVGQSQGGHAALAAAEVVKGGYGSEMRLRAVIAGAPGSSLEDRNWDPSLKDGIETMALVALTLENRDITASTYLTNAAMSAFWYTSNGQCIDMNGLASIVASRQFTGPWWKADPYAVPAARAVMRANSPGYVKVPTPIFVGQVLGDPLIRPARTRGFVNQSRAITGNDVTYCEYASIDNYVTMNNHDALRRIRDTSAKCMDSAGTQQFYGTPGTVGAVPVTMLEWLRRTWRTN